MRGVQIGLLMDKKMAFARYKIYLLLLLSSLAGCVYANGNDLTKPPATTDSWAPQMRNTPPLISEASQIPGLAVYSMRVSQDPVVHQIFLKDLATGKVTRLTDWGNNERPIWSPDGAHIMFLSWTKENSFDIYLMDRNGENQRPIVSGPASEIMADWSPDGSKIAFVSNEDGEYEIYAVDLQAQVTVRLSDSSKFASEFPKWSPGSPKWSPDGKRIAFVATTALTNTSQIFVMNADGTNIQVMTDHDLYYDDSPVWCPDASCIIFTRDLPKLMLLDIATKEATPLLGNLFDPTMQERALARSPMEGYLTFSVDGGFYALDIKRWEIYRLDIRASDLSLYP
jgi:Tol biopolymer transport system component